MITFLFGADEYDPCADGDGAGDDTGTPKTAGSAEEAQAQAQPFINTTSECVCGCFNLLLALTNDNGA